MDGNRGQTEGGVRVGGVKETIVASQTSDIMLPAEADKFPVTNQLQKSGASGQKRRELLVSKRTQRG